MVVPAPLKIVARWLLAAVAPAVALVVSFALQPLISQVPGPPFVAAIMLVAWLGGLGPALLAIALSAAALDFYFLTPADSFALEAADLLWLLLFGGVSLGTAGIIAARGRVQSLLAASEQQLRLVTDAAPTLICYVDADR